MLPRKSTFSIIVRILPFLQTLFSLDIHFLLNYTLHPANLLLKHDGKRQRDARFTRTSPFNYLVNSAYPSLMDLKIPKVPQLADEAFAKRHSAVLVD